jgi:uncharacterized protein YdeI (YjbR/CyaY-like superfamily)
MNIQKNSALPFYQNRKKNPLEMNFCSLQEMEERERSIKEGVGRKKVMLHPHAQNQVMYYLAFETVVLAF